MKNTILIVEDSPEVRSGLKIALEGQGYKVVVAGDGREGIKAFRESRPDIALLDIRMPRLSGIDVCTLIRNESDVPVIMFSGVDETEDVALAIQRGANDYVLKDTGFKELMARVAKHLRYRAASLVTMQPTRSVERTILPFTPAGGSAQQARSGVAKPRSGKQGSAPAQFEPAIDLTNESLENLAVVAHSDPESLNQLANITGRTSFEIAKASTGEQAIDVISARRPKLIVLGNTLKDMSCTAVIQSANRHPLGEMMGIVLAMGRRSPELARRARYLGVKEIVHAPWDNGSLDIAIRSALASTRAVRSRLEAA